MATSQGAQDRSRKQMTSETSGAPSSAEMNAIRSAITEGRQKAAVRLLGEANIKWRLQPGSWRWISESGSPERVISVCLLLSIRGHYDLAAAILAGMDHRDASVELRRSISRALDDGGQHELAVSLFNDLISTQEHDAEYTHQMRVRDTRRLGLAELYLTANTYVEEVPAPTPASLKGFVLVYNVGNPVLTGLMVPLVQPLMEQGYGLAAVTMGTLKTRPTENCDFDSLQGCVAPDGKSFGGGYRRNLSHEWRVDWTAGIVEADGINYFSYFQERLSQRAGRYKTNILTSPESAMGFAALQRRADVALSLCDKLRTLAQYGLPIRVALMDSHFAPQGIIREWCHQAGRAYGVHAIALSVGYENYFSNLTSLEATTLAVEDLTAQPEVRQPYLGGLHRLEACLAENPHLDRDPDDQLMSWVCQDRSSVGDDSSRSRDHVSREVHKVHSAGAKVFVALGKVSIDFAAPGDRGFAHDDFVSWINHLIEAVTGTDNLLLIKPHPHELRQEIVVQGVQLLRELVVPHLPQNVIFLQHDAFNTHELAELIDAAFLWNGTAVLEFSILGVPVVPASVWADRDYPVGLEVLRSRKEYEDVLSGKRALVSSAGVQRRAATFLRLMRSDHVAIPYRYLRRAATNLKIGAPTFDLGRLLELEKSPDPYVQRASSRFFEFP